MTKAIASVLLLLLNGCLRTSDLKDAHAARQYEIQSQKDERNAPTYGKYIADDVLSEDYLNRFVGKICEPSGMSRDDCFDKLQQVFFARMQERYKFADWQEVSLFCDGHPLECADFKSIEKAARVSHRRVVEAEADTRSREATEDFESSLVERKRAYWKNIARALNPPKSITECENTATGAVCETR